MDRIHKQTDSAYALTVTCPNQTPDIQFNFQRPNTTTRNCRTNKTVVQCYDYYYRAEKTDEKPLLHAIERIPRATHRRRNARDALEPETASRKVARRRVKTRKSARGGRGSVAFHAAPFALLRRRRRFRLVFVYSFGFVLNVNCIRNSLTRAL